MKHARMECWRKGENQALHCMDRRLPSGMQGGAWATARSACAADPHLARRAQGARERLDGKATERNPSPDRDDVFLPRRAQHMVPSSNFTVESNSSLAFPFARGYLGFQYNGTVIMQKTSVSLWERAHEVQFGWRVFLDLMIPRLT